MNYANYERDQKKFFKKVEGGTEHVGQIPEMKKFVKFWGDIWGKDSRTPEVSRIAQKHIWGKDSRTPEVSRIAQKHIFPNSWNIMESSKRLSKYHLSINFLNQKKTVFFLITEKFKTRTSQ